MNASAACVERSFGPADHDRIINTQPGLIVAGNAGRLPAAQPAGASVVGGELWWLPAAEERRADAALRLADRPGIRAVIISPANALTDRLGLACAFSTHLAQVRAARNLTGAWITAPGPPDCPAGTLRLPHLVTVTAQRRIDDVVVWELMTVGTARQWLDQPPPHQDFTTLVEERLTRLLQLRTVVRTRPLPDTPPGRQLAALLTRRYLSIRMVYQHPDLFTHLLTTEETLR